MKITEFLLARIAEDEAVARRVDSGPPIVQQLQAGIDHENGSLSGWVEVDAGRVLVECEAKRRIVELAGDATSLDMQVDDEFRVGPRDMDAEPYIGDLILRQLALPYAGHPDFDVEWATT